MNQSFLKDYGAMYGLCPYTCYGLINQKVLFESKYQSSPMPAEDQPKRT